MARASYLGLLQGNPVDRLIVRPTLVDLRIEVGTVSRGVFCLFMS